MSQRRAAHSEALDWTAKVRAAIKRTSIREPLGAFMNRVRIVCVGALFFWPLPAVADTGFLNRSVSIAGETYKHQVYVSADWMPQRKWPIVLCWREAGPHNGHSVNLMRQNPPTVLIVLISDNIERRCTFSSCAEFRRDLIAGPRGSFAECDSAFPPSWWLRRQADGTTPQLACVGPVGNRHSNRNRPYSRRRPTLIASAQANRGVKCRRHD
jgi:hypothetical protein